MTPVMGPVFRGRARCLGRILTLGLGIAAMLLGGLWLLQGLGLVQIRPILCFANCAPLQEPSFTWAIVGALVLVLGGLAIAWSLRRQSVAA